MNRQSAWLEFAADAYLDHRHRNWVLAEEVGVVYVAARGVVLVHRQHAEHVAAALGAGAEVARLEQLVALPAPAPVCPLPPPVSAVAAPGPQLTVAGTGISRRRDVLGWLGILAGAAVFVALWPRRSMPRRWWWRWRWGAGRAPDPRRLTQTGACPTIPAWTVATSC
jgi:hypothetical protein